MRHEAFWFSVYVGAQAGIPRLPLRSYLPTKATYSVVDGQDQYVGAHALERYVQTEGSILRYQRPTQPKDPYSAVVIVGVLPSEQQSGAHSQIIYHVT